MRDRTSILILSSLLLSSCGWNSSATVPSVTAPTVRQVLTGNPWVFVTARSPDPHIAATEVLAFAPAARYGVPIKISKNIRNAAQITTDTLGNLFVLDYGPPSSSATDPSLVRIFSPQYTSPLRSRRGASCRKTRLLSLLSKAKRNACNLLMGPVGPRVIRHPSTPLDLLTAAP